MHHAQDETGSSTPDSKVLAASRALEGKLATGQLELPLLPHVAARLLPLFANPDSDARQLSDLIRQDQSLTGHTLRIANSAAFGGRCRVDSLQHAVARLGQDLLRGLVMAVSLQNGVFQCRRFEGDACGWWRHALASALFSERIARIKKDDAELAFLCGLLHSVGKPITLNALVQIMTKCELELTRDQVMSLVDDHQVVVGRRIADRWKLPDAIGDSIECCADPSGTNPASVAASTALLATHFAHRALDPDTDDDELASRLGLSGENLAQLCEASDQVMEQVEAVAG